MDALIGTEKQLANTFRISKIATGQSSVSEQNLSAFVTSAFAAVERIAGDENQYSRNILSARVSEQIGVAGYDESFIPTVTGVLMSLRPDVDQRDLTTLAAQLRANIHDDFMVQAHELLDASCHVAALAIAGGVLENHRRLLTTSRILRWTENGHISKYNDALRNKAETQSVWCRIKRLAI